MRQVLVAGNPNAGKTTLFNRWAGTNARTGNYPGVTVERRTAEVGDGASSKIVLVDIPGTYSLSARSPEEQIAVSSILRSPADAVVVLVVDGTALARGLYLVHQVLECGIHAVVALNMMDEAEERAITIDHEGLAAELGVAVVPIVASTGKGVAALQAAVLDARCSTLAAPTQPGPLESALNEMTEACATAFGADERRARAWASWALLSLGEDDELEVPALVRETAVRLRASLEAAGVDVDGAIVGARYEVTDRLYTRYVREGDAGVSWTERIDRVLTHPVAGGLVFALVMLVIFESLFAWSDPMIGLVESGVAALQDLTRSLLPSGLFQDLIAEGVVAGVGNVVVFVPQIALLFVLIAVLEDSGYLARVAFVIDRLMNAVGLHGKAFVPLLSGFACAIPAVMATRTISDRKDRLVTMLALPLMSCSARLPVYVLITATVFVGDQRVFGILSMGAVVLFAMYGLSVVATLGAAAVMRRTVLKGPKPTLVLELPPYRRPLVRNVLSATWSRVRSFLVDAGTVILALTIVLWALLSFPKDDAVTAAAAASRDEVALDSTLDDAAREERLSEIDAGEASRQLERSYAGRLGKAIEPAIEPLGMDWRIGIGVIGAFAAREVFVSTLGIVFGIGGDADEASEPLRDSLRSATRADGSPLMTPLAGIALLVFFVLACQCMSTIAVVRRESGSWRWPLFMVAYMSALAYGAALLVYQVGAAMGWGTG